MYSRVDIKYWAEYVLNYVFCLRADEIKKAFCIRNKYIAMDTELNLKRLRVFICSEKISVGDQGVYYAYDDCNNMTVNMYLCPALKNMGKW
jgi:hypothetical protein